MDEDRRNRIQAYLVGTEGVSPEDARDFLDVLDASEDEDPDQHALLVDEIERRMAVTAAAVLAQAAGARETRATTSDVARLVRKARRVAG